MNYKNQNYLNPGWFIAGFVEGEGCFRVSIIRDDSYESSLKNITALPLKVRLYFQIGLHRKDEDILELIRSSLGVGKIYRSRSNRSNSSELQISSFKDLGAVINYFDK